MAEIVQSMALALVTLLCAWLLTLGTWLPDLSTATCLKDLDELRLGQALSELAVSSSGNKKCR